LAARAPSAVFGILTLCAAVILPRSSLSRGTRLALPLLIAASPGAAWYDREARSYALLLLLSTVITLACLRFLRLMPHEDGKARDAMITLTAAGSLGLVYALFRFSPGCGGLCDFLPTDDAAAQGDRRPRRLRRPCPVSSLGNVPLSVRRRATDRMDR